jgi:hypothetical protein
MPKKKEQKAIDKGIAEVNEKLKGFTPAKSKIKKAKSGDVKAAKGILEEFIGAINQNTNKKDGNPLLPHSPVEESVLRYLKECFEMILDQMEGGKRLDANKALNLTTGKKGALEKTLQRDMDIFLWVSEQALKTRNKRGSIVKAQEEYASNNNMTIDTVVKGYKRIKKRWFPKE